MIRCLNPKVVNWGQHPTTKSFAPLFKEGLKPLSFVSAYNALPCGKCWFCQKKKALDYTYRMFLEKKAHNIPPLCLTLTYSDKQHQLNGSLNLNYLHVQNFLKRLRKRYPYIRYFVAGEYGKNRNLPHWHIVIFGLYLSDLILKEKEGERYENGTVCKATQYFSPYIHNLWYVKDKKVKNSHRIGIIQDNKALVYVSGYSAGKVIDYARLPKNSKVWRNKVYIFSNENQTELLQTKVLPFHRSSKKLGFAVWAKVATVKHTLGDEPLYIEGLPYVQPKIYSKWLGLAYTADKHADKQKKYAFDRATLFAHADIQQYILSLKTLSIQRKQKHNDQKNL